MTERGVKLRRIVVLCVGAAFLLVLIGATIYCQTGYVSELPVVQLGRPEKGCLPLDAVLDTGEGVYFHYVQQEEGPWGAAVHPPAVSGLQLHGHGGRHHAGLRGRHLGGTHRPLGFCAPGSPVRRHGGAVGVKVFADPCSVYYCHASFKE